MSRSRIEADELKNGRALHHRQQVILQTEPMSSTTRLQLELCVQRRFRTNSGDGIVRGYKKLDTTQTLTLGKHLLLPFSEPDHVAHQNANENIVLG